MFLPKRRVQVAPPIPQPAEPPRAPAPLVATPILGTIVTTLGPGNQCRGRAIFDIAKPCLVVMHGARSNPSRGSLIAYYSPDVGASPFDPGIGRIPLFSDRVAWLWQAGRWVLDVQLDQTDAGATQNVDWDRFDVEDPLTALAFLNSFSQPFMSGLPVIVADKAIVLGATAVAITLTQALGSRAVLLQNTSAAAGNVLRVGFDVGTNHFSGVLPAAASGIPLAVGEKLLLQGATMPTSEIGVGSFVGAGSLSVTTWPWLWSLPV